MTTILINIADIVNDETGKTYRQENAEKQHAIPVGSLVEVEWDKTRLFVVSHERDCDQTPLYSLAVDPDDTVRDSLVFGNRKWHNGYPEYALRVVVSCPQIRDN